MPNVYVTRGRKLSRFERLVRFLKRIKIRITPVEWKHCRLCLYYEKDIFSGVFRCRAIRPAHCWAFWFKGTEEPSPEWIKHMEQHHKYLNEELTLRLIEATLVLNIIATIIKIVIDLTKK